MTIQEQKEKISKFAKYSGEVQSLTQLRNSPTVTNPKMDPTGLIFWVELNEKAYIVVGREGNKVKVSPLDEYATISTGVTIRDAAQSIYKDAPEVLYDNLQEEFKGCWAAWLRESFNDFYLLYFPKIHYFTIIREDEFADEFEVLKTVFTLVKDIGLLVDIEQTADGVGYNLWVRGADEVYEGCLAKIDNLIVHVPTPKNIINF